MDAIIAWFLKFLLLATAAGAVFVGKKYFNAKDDSLLEEVIEDVLEDQGIDVDLTPESKESNPRPNQN